MIFSDIKFIRSIEGNLEIKFFPNMERWKSRGGGRVREEKKRSEKIREDKKRLEKKVGARKGRKIVIYSFFQ